LAGRGVAGSRWAKSMYRSGATWVDIVAITDYLRHRFLATISGRWVAGYRGGIL
jgi:hypothetical protein